MSVSNRKSPSPWSATMIGIHSDPATDPASPQAKFKKESSEILSYLEGVHHSRKISHQQVNYSSTVDKLSKLQARIPIYNQKKEETKPEQVVTMRQKQYQDTMNDLVRSEQDLNYRKRLYNRQSGGQSVVHQIISGGAAPVTRTKRGDTGKEWTPRAEPVYPQKVTHNQVLAMTGCLAAPSATTQPPPVPRRKKWLGEEHGWEQ